MFFDLRKGLFATILMVVALAGSGFGQVAKQGEGSDLQRLDVMREKLDRMRRSLSSAISVLRDENSKDKSKKDDEKNIGTPLGRLVSLEKEASRLTGDVNNLRGKAEKSEKYDHADVNNIEQTVNELLVRVDTAQTETAKVRAATPDSPVGKPREKKGKKKFLGIIPRGSGGDEYDDLIGSVSPGRDRELFIVATREIRKKNFDVGRLLFQTIITTYPDSPYLPMAKLAVGDSFYLEGSTSGLIQAIASYQDWLTFFPTHPLSCRVILKIAESEMRQVGLPDRDATHAKRAETKLKVLTQQMPQCKDNDIMYGEAITRLKEIQDNLGLHSLGIANYYYNLSIDQKKGGLKGAQSRFREILDKYPDFSFADEVLYRIAMTYLVEEETDQAARYFQQIVRDYPNSQYVSKATDQLKLLGVTVPEPNPERMKILPKESPSFIQNFKDQFFGSYPMTIDKDGVLMTHDFDKEKFEMIDQIIENQGDILQNQIPKAMTTVISQRSAPQTKPAASPTPTPTPQPPKQ